MTDKYVLRIYRRYGDTRYIYETFEYDDLDELVLCMKRYNAKGDEFGMHFEYTINEHIKEVNLKSPDIEDEDE